MSPSLQQNSVDDHLVYLAYRLHFLPCLFLLRDDT